MTSLLEALASSPEVIVQDVDLARLTRRLHRRWMTLDAHHKPHTVATTAIARELAGWCWSRATMKA